MLNKIQDILDAYYWRQEYRRKQAERRNTECFKCKPHLAMLGITQKEQAEWNQNISIGQYLNDSRYITTLEGCKEEIIRLKRELAAATMERKDG